MLPPSCLGPCSSVHLWRAEFQQPSQPLQKRVDEGPRSAKLSSESSSSLFAQPLHKNGKPQRRCGGSRKRSILRGVVVFCILPRHLASYWAWMGSMSCRNQTIADTASRHAHSRLLEIWRDHPTFNLHLHILRILKPSRNACSSSKSVAKACYASQEATASLEICCMVGDRRRAEV